MFNRTIKPRKNLNEGSNYYTKPQEDNLQIPKKNYTKKKKSKTNSINQTSPLGQFFQSTAQESQQPQQQQLFYFCEQICLSGCLSQPNEELKQREVKINKQNLRRSMDDIKKNVTTSSINSKKALIKDILKYQSIINNNHIKTFFDKYITSTQKSSTLKSPTNQQTENSKKQLNSSQEMPNQSLFNKGKNKKIQSFDLKCMNLSLNNPYKFLLQKLGPSFTKEENIPKISLQYSFRTRQGQVINNPQKVNQDAFITIPKYLEHANQHLFAVCDGHGTYGHHVSAFLKSQIPVFLGNELNQKKDVKEALLQSFENCSNALGNTEINTTLSGSTMTLSLLQDNKIYTANSGDSRAIIARKVNSDYQVIELSKDHKPELPQELARILRMGGRVEPIVDWEGGGGYLGPNRVWLQGQNFPGLAMSRSFGDAIAASVGVISMPEITEFNLEPDMKFIIVASDGVWEYIDNQEVQIKGIIIFQQCVNLVGHYFEQNDLEGACDCLLNESYKRWTYEEDTVIDDITLIIIFLKFL